MENYPSLRYLLEKSAERLFPEERLELQAILGRLARLEKVYEDAERLTKELQGKTLFQALYEDK